MTQAISPLRQRMIEDMRMRKFSPKTQNAYIRAVRRFAAFLGRTPDSANDEDLRRYQLHLVVQGISPISLNATITALKFFFEVADIFRAHGPAWRQAQHGHLSLGQLKGMSAIEQCRSAALGGTPTALRRLRADADRLQLLRQPALPAVPRTRRTPLALSPPGRPA